MRCMHTCRRYRKPETVEQLLAKVREQRLDGQELVLGNPPPCSECAREAGRKLARELFERLELADAAREP